MCCARSRQHHESRSGSRYEGVKHLSYGPNERRKTYRRPNLLWTGDLTAIKSRNASLESNFGVTQQDGVTSEET